MQLNQLYAHSKNVLCVWGFMQFCERSNTLAVSGVGKASIVKQMTQREVACALKRVTVIELES